MQGYGREREGYSAGPLHVLPWQVWVARRSTRDSPAEEALNLSQGREFATGSLVQLQAHGFDLLAQVEAFLRHVREIQQNVAVLKESRGGTRRVEALHQIRTHASDLLRDCTPFCDTVGEVQKLTAEVTPEQRVQSRPVANERRRRQSRMLIARMR